MSEFASLTKYFVLRFQQEKKALDELSTDLELADEDRPVRYAAFQLSGPLISNPLTTFLSMYSYKVGEAFLHMPQSCALKRLE